MQDRETGAEDNRTTPPRPENDTPTPSPKDEGCGACDPCRCSAGHEAPDNAPADGGGTAGPEAEAPPDGPQPARPSRPGWVCTLLHGKMSRVEPFSAPEGRGFPHGRKVIVRTERGTEMATVISSPREVNLFQVRGLAGQVLRAATPEDLERQAKIEGDVEPNEMRECQADIDAARLPMRLVEVEHVFGGEKVVFYFTADGRVDFRHLVREIAHKYRTRIEFRQVGVRDEARLLAEYEHCGQPLCCRSFLRGLEPVTMRMAKLQKATLDPTKISGRCGRLMCCLRYEEEAYAYLRTQLPARGVYVLTDELTGQVLSGDIISQRVTLDSGGRRVNIKVADIKQVSDTPLAAPAPRVPAEPVHVPPPRREQRAPRQNAPSGGGRPLPGRRPEPARQQQGSSIQPRAEDRAGGAGQPGQAGQLGQPGQPGRPDARPGGRPGRRRGRRRGGRHHGRGGAAAPPAGPAG